MPLHARALFATLALSNSRPELLNDLDDIEWRSLLDLADRMQLTLLFGELGRPYLPLWVSERIDRNYRDNGLRFSRLQTALAEIEDALAAQSIPFAVLKGFTHSSHFSPHPSFRSQGDIDIWCPPDLVLQAKDVLSGLGYRPIDKSKGRHLDPMIREVHWEWTGDYFAPDLPIPVDLHYRLWDEDMEHIAGPNETDIWNRRCPAIMTTGQMVPQLALVDAVAFASLHVLMHLLHGDLRLQRAWELAFFLQAHSGDQAFWTRWNSLYSRKERLMQVIPFALSHTWFACELPSSIRAEINMLPKDVLFWFERYSWSPVDSLFTPNKDELLLNLSLLQSTQNRARVFIRRLLPVYAILGGSPSNNSGQTVRSATAIGWRFTLHRAGHHLRQLPLTCWRTLVWWWEYQKAERIFTFIPSLLRRLLAVKPVDDGRH